MDNKICFTWGSKRYHRATWKALDSPSPFGNRGYWRSVCGVIDAQMFAHFWVLDETSERLIRRVRNGELTPCKRCFPADHSIDGVNNELR
jgi:hypothetical protein